MSLLCDEMKNLATELQAEVGRARAKFPGAHNLNAALMEEVGELATAQLQNLGAVEIRKEAIQVMAVAYRIMTEGDASMVITPETTLK